MERELLRFLLGEPVNFTPLRAIRYGAETGIAIGSALGKESARLRAVEIYAPFQADWRQKKSYVTNHPRLDPHVLSDACHKSKSLGDRALTDEVDDHRSQRCAD